VSGYSRLRRKPHPLTLTSDLVAKEEDFSIDRVSPAEMKQLLEAGKFKELWDLMGVEVVEDHA
jgi:hypothetical protein